MRLKNEEKYVGTTAVNKLRKTLIYKQLLSWTGHLVFSSQFE
jgi:hypothetical protein|tara:strand:- start:512 stop:637 length:126 start_codon:yes stop_codon:yes gene_type:complete